MPRELNRFSGRSDASVRAEMRQLRDDWKAVRSGDGHGGSPGEGILEQLDDVTHELEARGLCGRCGSSWCGDAQCAIG